MGLNNFSEIDFDVVKGILWDLDNTLYDYKYAHQKAIQESKIIAIQNYQIPDEDFNFYWDKARSIVHKDLYGQGASHSRLLYFQKMFELKFGRTNAVFSLEMEEVYWSCFLQNMVWKNGVEEFLLQAKNKGIKMAVVTDLTAQIQLRKWIHFDLSRFMSFMVSSEEAGKEKPNAIIFNLALEKLALKPFEVVMVGDNQEKDIEGAKELGIKTVLVQ